MESFAFGLDAALALLRTAVFGVTAVVAVLAAASYAVRTRRLNPFGPAGRLVRDRVDPLFRPMERRVVRAGGMPTSAPWWTLAGVAVAGLLLLYVLGFVRTQLLVLTATARAGAGPLLVQVVVWTFAVLQLALFVRVLSSWFGLGPYSPWVRWAFRLTDWIIEPLRRVVPPLGVFDLTPIVAYFALSLLERLVVGVLAGAVA